MYILPQLGYADLVWDNCSPKLSEHLESDENQTHKRFKIQHVNIRGNPLYGATKRHLNNN